MKKDLPYISFARMLAILLVVNSHATALAVTLVLAAALKFCSGRVSRLVGIGR